jgi:hypothetical protein
MTSKTETLISHAQSILDAADAAGRYLSAAECQQVRDLTDRATLQKDIERLGARLSSPGGSEEASGGLYAAMAGQGYNRIEHPSVSVPFNVFGTGSFDGDYGDAVRYDVAAPPLGADSRFLFPSLAQQSVDPEVTSISSFRQKSRTLPTLSTMIRAIAAVTPKPEVATVTEVVTPSLHQIAAVETDVPNIMLESAAFAGWINTDLRFAYATAGDYHVVTQIAATTPTQAAARADLLEAIVNAAELVASAGYAPRIIAAGPETLIDLLLLKQPGTDDYVGASMDRVLSGLQRVAVAGMTGTCYVLDPAALGTLYASPVRVQSFEQDAGSTNSSTDRIESNALYLVQRADAVAEVPVSS